MNELFLSSLFPHPVSSYNLFGGHFLHTNLCVYVMSCHVPSCLCALFSPPPLFMCFVCPPLFISFVSLPLFLHFICPPLFVWSVCLPSVCAFCSSPPLFVFPPVILIHNFSSLPLAIISKSLPLTYETIFDEVWTGQLIVPILNANVL